MITEKMIKDYIANMQIIHDAPCDHEHEGIIGILNCVMRKTKIKQTIALMEDLLNPSKEMLEAMENTAELALEIKEREMAERESKKQKKKKEPKKNGEDYPNIRGTKPSAN